MGSLYILILINDALCYTCCWLKYVQDSTVGITIDNASQDYISVYLKPTLNWASVINTVNLNKTALIHFNTSIIQFYPPEITICAHYFTVVESTMILEFILNNKLY